MEVFEMKQEDGSMVEVPCLQLELSRYQQILIMAADFNNYKTVNVKGGKAGLFTRPIGKLESLGKMFQLGLMNTMSANGWNFQRYPNPEIIIITDKSTLN